MDYVLLTYGCVLFTAAYGAIWTLGGHQTRLVLSLGAWAYHPSYSPPSREWRRSQSSLRGHIRPADDFPSWHQHFATTADEPLTPALDAAPTVVIPTLLVHAEQADDQIGAEHWGDLLKDMRTEEREVYNAAMVETHEEAMAVQRSAFARLDEVIADFQRDNDRGWLRDSARLDGLGTALLRPHGGWERWATGQLPLLEPAP